MTSAADEVTDEGRHRLGVVWLVFTVTWSASVLFHLAGNTRLAPEWGRACLGLVAVALLARPRSVRLAQVLATAVLVNVWLEAPVLGSHWLLHGFVAVTVLGGSVNSSGSGGNAMRRIVGPLRLLLLAFYVFAAFAKLNQDFFDPAVSCGVYYLEESAQSWGMQGLVEGWSSASRRALTILVAGVELLIPVLLVARRTRRAAVLLALAFHFLLALDRTHQFFDFSSVLVTLFLLFLPPDAVADGVGRLRCLCARVQDRWESGPELLRLAGLAAAGMVAFIAGGPDEWPAPPLLRSVGVAVWVPYGLGAIAFATWSVRRSGAQPERLVGVGTSALLLAIPVLAFLNGLTPYFEVKTSASWNMYSNLAVVDGDSNHLLVRSGLPLTDAHERLVEVTQADGVDLDFYIGTDWLVPEVMLEDHVADRPEAVVLGRVDGEPVRYVGGNGDSRPLWQRKLQVFRAVDASGAAGCQPSFGPAR